MSNRTDNFNRTDSSTALGTPSDAGSAWSALAGTWGIATNQGYVATSSGGLDAAVLESSVSDVEVEVTLATAGTTQGVIARATDVNNYLVFLLNNGFCALYKIDAGVKTFIYQMTGSNLVTSGDVFKFRAQGSTCTFYKNGTEVGSTTSTFNQTATKHGIYSENQTTPRFDTFSITGIAELSVTAPAKALIGQSSINLTLVGIGTAWTGATTFTVSGVTGVAKVSQTVNSGTSATVEIETVGGVTGTLTVSDGTLNDTIPVTDTATTIGAGNWGTAATWDVNAVPTLANGNLAVISHNVDVAATGSIGNSPAEGNAVLTIDAGKTLTVKTGVAFTVAGDITCNGTLQVGETGGGATLEFDASGAGSPSTTNYKLLLNITTATFRIRGTTGAHSAVRSNSGGGNAYTNGAAGNGGGVWDGQWCDFLRMGDATNAAINSTNTVNPGSVEDWIALTDCTFTSGGRITGATFPANAAWDLLRVTFATTAASECIRLIGSTAGISSIDYCAFDKTAFVTPATAGLNNCMLGASLDHANDATWQDIAGCVFWIDDVLTGAHSLRGNITDSYFFAGGTDNPHFPLTRDVSAAKTCTGCIVEYGGGFSSDTGNAFYGSGDWALVDCIILESATSGIASGAVTFATVGISLTHCTLYSPDYTGGILIGDGGSATGMYPTVKSCIFWVNNADPDGVAAHSIGTTADNAITPGNCTHNGLLNIAATAYQGSYPTTQPGANDVRLDSTDETTVFADRSRNVATWAVSRGSAGSTYADKAADAKAYLLADPTLIPDLLAHVRAGFIVKYGPWRTAAHDGTVVGAVQEALQSTGARRTEIRIGQIAMIRGL